MPDIPKRFPSRSADRGVVSLGFIGDMILRMEMEFPERLNAERLAKALDLALDAEPILGCRFVHHWRRPYWERVTRAERGVLQVADMFEQYEAFRKTSIDIESGPQIEACLWRPPDTDYLLLHVSHAVADAGGVKEVAALVSRLYSRLAAEPKYVPEPNIRASRSCWQALRHIPWHAYPRGYLESLRDSWSLTIRPSNQTLPTADNSDTELVFISRFLPSAQMSRMDKYRRSRHATLNDLMLAAFLRALAVLGTKKGHSQLRLATTVDLRRYVPSRKGETIANLSVLSLAWPCLSANLGGDFESTLARVTAITQKRKANWIGLSECVVSTPQWILPYVGAKKLTQQMVRRAIRQRNHQASFTNMGMISPESVTFGVPAAKAHILPPASYPPAAIIIGMTGYSGSLTLSSGVCCSQKDVVGRFLDQALAELPD